MISEAQLNQLDKAFRLSSDSETAQLGIRLIAEVRGSRGALVAAAVPLEELADHIRSKPYSELSSDFQTGVLATVEQIEEALECHECGNAVADPQMELQFCEIDGDGFENEQQTREYFQCALGGEHNVFKFTLNSEVGDFQLHTFLNQDVGFFVRLWRGLRYAFGYRSKSGHWDCVVMDRSMTERLHRLTNEALDSMHEKALQSLK